MLLINSSLGIIFPYYGSCEPSTCYFSFLVSNFVFLLYESHIPFCSGRAFHKTKTSSSGWNWHQEITSTLPGYEIRLSDRTILDIHRHHGVCFDAYCASVVADPFRLFHVTVIFHGGREPCNPLARGVIPLCLQPQCKRWTDVRGHEHVTGCITYATGAWKFPLVVAHSLSALALGVRGVIQ